MSGHTCPNSLTLSDPGNPYPPGPNSGCEVCAAMARPRREPRTAAHWAATDRLLAEVEAMRAEEEREGIEA